MIAADAPEDALTPPPPTELQIEVTGSCNLSCQMCLVAYRPKLGRSASFSLASVRRVLDDLPSVRRLTLQGLGEPLLAPDLEAIIAEAVRRGIEVGFNSNGTLLTRERSDRLIAAGLNWLHVSIDGARPETFAEIRRGGQLDKVVANLRALVTARADAERAHPWIQMNTVLMRANHREVDALVRLAADIGVDRLWIQGLSHEFTDVAGDPAFIEIGRWTDRQLLRPDEVERMLGEAAALARRLGLDLRLPAAGSSDGGRRPGERGCDWPWRSAYVSHDGGVQPCCMLMGRHRGRVGNVHEQPLSELWRQPDYVELRAGLLGDDPPAICQGCSVYRHRF